MRRLLILCMFVLSGIPVHAGDNAVTLHGGLEHTASSAYEDGPTVSARYERRVLGDLWFAGEYTWHGPMEHHTRAEPEFSYGDVSGHSILGDLIYYPKWAKIHGLQPYLIGGAGWSWWDFNRSREVEDLGVGVELGDAFAYKAGFGLTARITGPWFVVIEWSFFKADIPKDAVNADGTPSILLGDDDKTGRVTIGEEEMRFTTGIKAEF